MYATGLSYFPSDQLSVPRVTHCLALLPHNVLTVEQHIGQSLSSQSSCAALQDNSRFFNLQAVV